MSFPMLFHVKINMKRFFSVPSHLKKKKKEFQNSFLSCFPIKEM